MKPKSIGILSVKMYFGSKFVNSNFVVSYGMDKLKRG